MPLVRSPLAFPPDVEAEEVEPVAHVHHLRLGLGEPKSWGFPHQRSDQGPRSRTWADTGPGRSVRVRGNEHRVFATKPRLARALIARAVQAKIPAGWVAGDEVYDADPHLRADVRTYGMGYVLAIAANRRVPTHAGSIRVDKLPALIPRYAWQRHSAGAGAHGPRPYSWAWFRLLPEDDTDHGVHHLLIRRNDTTGEHAYLRCYSPRPVPLHTLVQVAGQRWRIEESFQAAKGLTSLDQHPARTWTSWHRWTTLASLDHPGHAHPRVLDRDHHHPTPPRTSPDRAHRPHCRRAPPTLRRTPPHNPPQPRTPTRLVNLAPTTPSHRPPPPLPTQTTTMITNYNCRTRAYFGA